MKMLPFAQPKKLALALDKDFGVRLLMVFGGL